MNRPPIPEKIKRQVRQHDGFGCVICGLGIYEYEHIEPYADVKKHEVDNVVLLCHQCHGKVTRGFYSKDKVLNAKNNPKCKQNGFTRETLEFHENSNIELAGNRFFYTQIILQYRDTPIIWINPGTEVEPVKLNAIFLDNNGDKILIIKDNEWIAGIDNWDIKSEGGKLIIKSAIKQSKLVLDFKTKSPDILITELNMNIFGNIIKAKDNILYINGNTLQNCISIGCHVGIQI